MIGEVRRHDGSCLFPVGVTSRDIVQVSNDGEFWSEPVMAGMIEWSINNDNPVIFWRYSTKPQSA